VNGTPLSYAGLPYSPKPAFFARGQNPPSPKSRRTSKEGSRWIDYEPEFGLPIPGRGHALDDFANRITQHLAERKSPSVTLSRTLPSEKLSRDEIAGLRLTRDMPRRFTAHVEVIVTRSGPDLFVTAHSYARLRGSALSRERLIYLTGLGVVLPVLVFSIVGMLTEEEDAAGTWVIFAGLGVFVAGIFFFGDPA